MPARDGQATGAPLDGGRYFRIDPTPSDKRMGLIFPRHTAGDPALGNWQDDDGEWQSPRATEQIAAEITADLAAGLLEERGRDRCPTCGRPLPAQADATN